VIHCLSPFSLSLSLSLSLCASNISKYLNSVKNESFISLSLFLHSLLVSILFRQGGNIIITSKYAHCRHTSRPPADVSLPFLGYRYGGFDSCVCLLSRQENHRTEVKKHVLPNVSLRLNGVPGKSFEAILPVCGSPTGRNLKNAWKPPSRKERGKGSCGAEGPRPRKKETRYKRDTNRRVRNSIVLKYSSINKSKTFHSTLICSKIIRKLISFKFLRIFAYLNI